MKIEIKDVTIEVSTDEKVGTEVTLRFKDESAWFRVFGPQDPSWPGLAKTGAAMYDKKGNVVAYMIKGEPSKGYTRGGIR